MKISSDTRGSIYLERQFDQNKWGFYLLTQRTCLMKSIEPECKHHVSPGFHLGLSWQIRPCKICGIVCLYETFACAQGIMPFFKRHNNWAWLSVRGTTITGTVLSSMEFSDFYVLVKKLTP